MDLESASESLLTRTSRLGTSQSKRQVLFRLTPLDTDQYEETMANFRDCFAIDYTCQLGKHAIELDSPATDAERTRCTTALIVVHKCRISLQSRKPIPDRSSNNVRQRVLAGRRSFHPPSASLSTMSRSRRYTPHLLHEPFKLRPADVDPHHRDSDITRDLTF